MNTLSRVPRSWTLDRPDPTLQRRSLVADPGFVIMDLLDVHDLGDQLTGPVNTGALQFVAPVHGVHYVRDGARETLVDCNQLTIIQPGVVTRERHPSRGDFSCLLLTPSDELVDSLWKPEGRALAAASGGGCGNVPLPLAALRRAVAVVARLRRWNAVPVALLEELTIDLVRIAAHGHERAETVDIGHRGRRLIAAVKDMLATSTDSLSVTGIAKALRVSPSYLTDIFRRVEGIPIYRYQMRLKLGRALTNLPDTQDLTGLALDLGFSSHSHFSSVFRAAFGMSPSQFRAGARIGPRAGST